MDSVIIIMDSFIQGTWWEADVLLAGTHGLEKRAAQHFLVLLDLMFCFRLNFALFVHFS